MSAATRSRLEAVLPADASLRNPVDMIASARPAAYRAALDAVLDDPVVDSAIAIFVPPIAARQAEVAEAIARARPGHLGKPLLAVLMGRKGLPQGRAELQGAAVPAYVFPESAARSLAAMVRQREWSQQPVEPLEALPVDRTAASVEPSSGTRIELYIAPPGASAPPAYARLREGALNQPCGPAHGRFPISSHLRH